MTSQPPTHRFIKANKVIICCSYCNVLYSLASLLSCTAAAFVLLFLSPFMFFHVNFFLWWSGNQLMEKLVENPIKLLFSLTQFDQMSEVLGLVFLGTTVFTV